MAKIKLSDFDWERSHSLDDVCKATMERQDFILGQSVRDFEKDFAQYCQAEHAVAVANCTDALRLALQTLGVGPGTNVVTVGLTWLSTYEVIANLGADIRLVDVDDYLTIDPTDALLSVDSNTRAIIGVDLFGQSCDWDKLQSEVPTISDAAQATGARYHNRQVGSIADITCFSFYPTKNLGCLGDGGAITTANTEYADAIRKLRNHGQSSKFNVDYVGWNSRLDTIQADILRAKLPHLDSWNERRRSISDYYDQSFKNLFELVPVRPNSHHVRHQYVVMTEQADALQQELAKFDIESRRYYQALAYQQQPYGVETYLPNTERYSQLNLAIPTHQFLTDNQVSLIASIVKRVLE